MPKQEVTMQDLRTCIRVLDFMPEFVAAVAKGVGRPGDHIVALGLYKATADNLRGIADFLDLERK
jgi:hypothetical protein